MEYKGFSRGEFSGSFGGQMDGVCELEKFICD